MEQWTTIINKIELVDEIRMAPDQRLSFLKAADEVRFLTLLAQKPGTKFNEKNKDYVFEAYIWRRSQPRNEPVSCGNH